MNYLRVFEKCFLLASVAGIFFWFHAYAGSLWLILLGILTLGLLYFFAFEAISGIKKPSEKKKLWIVRPSVVFRLGLVVLLSGFLQWFMLWPNAKQVLSGGLVLLLCGFVWAFTKKDPILKSSGAISRVLPVALLAIGLMIAPRFAHIAFKYTDDPVYRDAYIYWLENPELESAYDEWHQLHCRRHPQACGHIN